MPVFGTLLSVVVLGEAFYAYHAIALALVLGGIWLAETAGESCGGAAPKSAPTLARSRIRWLAP